MTADVPRHLLLYAAVPDAAMLDQGFYAAEVEGLRSHPAIASVSTTNLLSDVRRSDYDGLIGYFYSHAAVAAAIARLRGKPAVLTGGGEQLFPDPKTSLSRRVARRTFFQLAMVTADCLLATSSTDAARMRELALVGRKRILLSYHGAPAADRIDRANFEHPRRPASFVTICGLDTPLNVRRKGVFAAIDLVARARVTHSGADLIIIGRTTCRAMVEDYAQARGVAGAVTFAGYVDEAEKQAILRSRRFYVQLSEYEGFGIGALEALALGCQVIHSNVGGLRDTVGELGVIVSPEAAGYVEIDTLPAYPNFDWTVFECHMAQFRTGRRADTIVATLGLAKDGADRA